MTANDLFYICIHVYVYLLVCVYMYAHRHTYKGKHAHFSSKRSCKIIGLYEPQNSLRQTG